MPKSNVAQRGSRSTRADRMVRAVTPCVGVTSNELLKSQNLFGDNCLYPQTQHVEEKNNLCRNIVDKAEEMVLTSTKKRNKVLP